MEGFRFLGGGVAREQFDDGGVGREPEDVCHGGPVHADEHLRLHAHPRLQRRSGEGYCNVTRAGAGKGEVLQI